MLTTISKDSPIDYFPFLLKGVTEALHENTQAPLSLCCNSILSAATLVSQSFVDVEIDGRRMPVSNYFVTITESGGRKTTVDGIVLRPIKEWIKERFRKTSGIKQDFKVPLQIVNSLTLEGLRDQLNKHAPSVGIFSNEGGAVLSGYSMGGGKIDQFLAILSTLWDGGEWSFVLAHKDPVVLYDRRVSMHLLIQEHLKDKILGSDKLWDQGMLSRMFIVNTKSNIGRRLYKPNNINNDHYFKEYKKRIASILGSEIEIDKDLYGSLKTKVLKLSSDAMCLWVNFYNDIERDIGLGGKYRNIINFANKLPDSCLRIAAVFEYFEHPEANEISELSLDKATHVALFYMNHLLWLLNNLNKLDPDEQFRTMLVDWLYQKKHQGWDVNTIKPSIICQRGPNPIRNGKVELVRRLIAQLENEGKLIPKVPSEEWRVNWDLLGKIT